MIENKELGLKIAESDEEMLWENVKREAEALIKQSKNNLIIQKELLKLSQNKLKTLNSKGGF